MKTVIWLLAVFAVAAAARDAARTALIGSWKLVSYEDKGPDGVTVFPYGKAPAGLLMYDATGHMSVQIMKTPAPVVSGDDPDNFSAEKKTSLFDGYAAYFGRYEIDTARQVVTHLPEAHLQRIYMGRREERHYRIKGDQLELSETWSQGGKQWSGTRVFERIR